MALIFEKLTASELRTLSRPGRYSDGGGLYLQVTRTGVKTWIFRFERDGKERWMGLGALHTVDVKRARAKAKDARLLLDGGLDPLEEKARQRAAREAETRRAISFRVVAEEYHRDHRDEWRSEKHSEQFLTSLRAHVFPIIGDLPIAEVDRLAVLRVLKPLWIQKTVTANRIRGRIEKVINSAVVSGYREEGPNPARWRGGLDALLARPSKIATVEHLAALPYKALPDFMLKVAAKKGTAPKALAFLILTGARTGEVIGARWAEIDLAAKMWTVPAHRMKSARQHVIPLSAPAVALLDLLPRGSEYVFPSDMRRGQHLSASAMSMLVRTGLNPEITCHGFRSTFRDWASDNTAFPSEVVEIALAHVVGNATQRAYARSNLFEQRARLMEAWGAYCSLGELPSNVTPLRSASTTN